MKRVFEAEDSAGFNNVHILAEDEEEAWRKWGSYLSFIVGYTLTMEDVELATAMLIELDETRITGVFKC